MKFGIFYEHQLPRPWNDDSEYELMHQALDQAPEVFLAAASQRTKRIRLAHGIIQLTTNHPARVAERVSTLDLLSGGRVELGIGEGSSVTELHPFERRFRDKRAVWEDAVRCLIPMFSGSSVEYHGEYFDFPARNVVPKPRQKPHPPLWVACSQMETIEMAGRRGLGALAFQFLSAEAAKAWVSAYYDGFLYHQDKLADYPANPNIALVSAFMCCATDEEAKARADGATFFQFALGFYGRSGPIAPGSVDLWEEYQAYRSTEKGQAAVERMGGLIGSPETLRRRLRKFEESNIDQVILLAQAGKNRHEDICDSLRLFAAEVMPEFHDHEEEHQAWKQGVLSGEIELPRLDTSQHTFRTTGTPVTPAQLELDAQADAAS
jgi:alkanesulfonate monooxygenase SsuD/methylene tetrahydromethanopterin reductase-like flavin-dependent oxidoreductase (luciferase family)